MKFKSPLIPADDIDDAIEVCYQRGWTDGLPVVPPTEAKVARMIDCLGRKPQELVGVIPPMNGFATIEKLAINSVMAGCLPAYFPVVIAAVEAMLERQFNLNGVQATTHPVAPLTIVSGPAVKELGFNCGDGVFGGGSRANAAVGRAVRLILWNIGGAFPGEIDRSTMGQPGKYVYCIAENQDANPWEPLHVERGLDPETSAVTVFGCEGPHHALTAPGTAMTALTTLADCMATLGSNNTHFGGQCLVVLCPRAASVLSQEGWTKHSIREALYEDARIPVSKVKRGPTITEKAADFPGWPGWIDPNNDDALIPVIRKAEDIHLVVAGGWGALGAMCAICPGWGYMGGHAQTKPIHFPK